MSKTGRLRVANNGTEEHPKYVVLGLVTNISIFGMEEVAPKEPQPVDLHLVLGELIAKPMGAPVKSGYGLSLDEVWLASSSTFRAIQEGVK